MALIVNSPEQPLCDCPACRRACREHGEVELIRGGTNHWILFHADGTVRAWHQWGEGGRRRTWTVMRPASDGTLRPVDGGQRGAMVVRDLQGMVPGLRKGPPGRPSGGGVTTPDDELLERVRAQLAAGLTRTEAYAKVAGDVDWSPATVQRHALRAANTNGDTNATP